MNGQHRARALLARNEMNRLTAGKWGREPVIRNLHHPTPESPAIRVAIYRIGKNNSIYRAIAKNPLRWADGESPEHALAAFVLLIDPEVERIRDKDGHLLLSRQTDQTMLDAQDRESAEG